MKKKKLFIVGVDEAGRGPLAGSIAVGAVAAIFERLKIRKPDFRNRRCGRAKFSLCENFRDKRFLKSGFLVNIKDSKKLSAKQREKWREVLIKNFECRVSLVGPQIIDKIGIQRATRLAVSRVLRKFELAPDLVLLDGSMSAPEKYNQQTIIRGDEKVPLISAASIIAKTARDAKMLRLHKKFSQYCFDQHKGYGTKLHYKMLKKHGLCSLHRRSFIF